MTNIARRRLEKNSQEISRNDTLGLEITHVCGKYAEAGDGVIGEVSWTNA
jgi:hypothetical protein